MKFGLSQLKRKTPKSAKQWGVLFATISTGIGTVGYLTAFPIYVHIGAVSFMLSVAIPFLFGENDNKTINTCNCAAPDACTGDTPGCKFKQA